MVHAVGSLDYPLTRQQGRCPTCGAQKSLGQLFCWPCHRGGKSIPDFGQLACREMERHLQEESKHAR